ncbi:MAG: extracellular solute-binding protein [Clostridia bacterium]|nr:extracellular solute-binding protein [Clostridia bacterium]
MKGKLFKGIAAVGLCAAMALGGAGCNWTQGDYDPDVDLGQNDTSDRSGWVLRERKSADDFSDKILNITYFNGGYGSEWIEEMKSEFEKDYPGVTVRLTASDDINGTLKVELENSPEDIYISHDIAWETLGGQGLLADLTESLYGAQIYTDTKNTEETEDDVSIRFRDLLTPSSLSSSVYYGKFYKVAQVQGAGGIIYNKTMFEKNGWQVPKTYAQLEALCETIYQAGEVPFLVAGTEGYLWDSLVYDWWIQIAGEEEFLRLFEGNDKTCWNPAVYPHHKKAYEYWYNLFVKNQNKYLYPQFEGINNIMANQAFLNGMAAMMPATAWAVNELGSEMIDEAKIDVGLIPTPYVPEAKKDEEGNFIRVCYDVAGRDSIVVAERGNKDLAVEFLKWMSETENTLIFPKNVSGMLLGFKYEIPQLLKDKDTYCKYSWDEDMITLLGEAKFRSTGYSANPMFVQKLVSAYPLENFYLRCFTTFGKPGAVTPDSIFEQAWNQVDAKWSDWRFQAGLKD